MIIGISGKINSGKDTVGEIIQYLSAGADVANITLDKWDGKPVWGAKDSGFHKRTWENKKFADELKNTICRWLGCTREQLEDRDFKEGELGEEWDKYKLQVEVGEVDEVYYFNTFHDAEKYFESHFRYYPNKDLLHYSTCWHHTIEKVIMTPRLMLQLLGTNCGRDIIHPNIWVNSLMSQYKHVVGYADGHYMSNCGKCGEEFMGDKRAVRCKECSVFYPNWLVTDTRFPNEAEAVLERNGLLIRVNRGDGNTGNHPSETSLDNYNKWSYIIDNNGSIADLVQKVREILIKEKLI